MPLVSVLMPCYNAVATLDEALASLFNQSLTDFEIIAVDDGSDDGTAELLQAWAGCEPRLKILSQSHSGIVSALNAGLAICQAPYIARMDSDDYAYPQRLASQSAFLDAHPLVDVVGCRVSGFPEDQVRQGFQIYLDWLNGLMTDQEIRREIFVESPLPHPSVMVRRQAILGAGGYQDHGWPEDYDLWLRLYLRGAQFAKLPDVLLAWREHPKRLTRIDPRYSLENFLRAKAYYLAQGPLRDRRAIFLWGAGMIGRRLGKLLSRQGLPLAAYIDIDPAKIGRSRRGLPILPPEELLDHWRQCPKPALLAAVGARGARQLIRQRLNAFGLVEGVDWWGVA